MSEMEYGSDEHLDGLSRDALKSEVRWWHGRALEMEAENAKLRKLCWMFAEYVSYDRCEGCICKSRCNDGEIDECWQLAEIREAAHELGVEVHA